MQDASRKQRKQRPSIRIAPGRGREGWTSGDNGKDVRVFILLVAWPPDVSVLRSPSQPLAFLIFTNANTPVLFPWLRTIVSQNCPLLYGGKEKHTWSPFKSLKIEKVFNQSQPREQLTLYTLNTQREKAHCRASLYCSFCPSEAIGLGRADGSEYFSFISVVDKTKHWQKAAYGRKNKVYHLTIPDHSPLQHRSNGQEL